MQSKIFRRSPIGETKGKYDHVKYSNDVKASYVVHFHRALRNKEAKDMYYTVRKHDGDLHLRKLENTSDNRLVWS